MMGDIKKDLTDSRLTKEIEKAYDQNTNEIRRRLGWGDETKREEWIRAETIEYENKLANDKDDIDIEKYKDDAKFFGLFKVRWLLFTLYKHNQK